MREVCGDKLPLYVAGVLDADDSGSVEEHLAECANCREAVREWRAIACAVRANASERLAGLPPLLPVGRATTHLPTRRSFRSAWWQGRTALALTTAALSAILVIALAWPGVLTTAAQGIEALVQSLVLGRHTTVQQVSSATATPTKKPTTSEQLVVERRGDSWIIRTAIGTLTSPALLPGRDVSVRHYTDLERVQEAVSFDLRLPGYLPPGYTFREAIVTPLYRAFLLYGGPDGDIILLQMPVGQQPGGESDHSLYAVVEMLTDQPFESATLDGQQAAWVGDRCLMWEAHGINFILGGGNLSLEEATRIAQSLE